MIVVSIQPLDLIKANVTISSVEEVGTTESTGKKGVNKSYKLTDSEGKSWVFKPKEEEHVSKWRYVPPHTQYKREKAAYLVDSQLGFGMVPETKIVEYGDMGIGSVQKWIEKGKNVQGDPDKFVYGLDEDASWKSGLFDAIIGNIDRHSGNWLIEDSKVWLIDNGFSFPSRASEDDNKSVILSRFVQKIWERDIPDNYMNKLQRLKDKEFQSQLKKLLDKEAFDLFLERLRHLLRTGVCQFPKYKIRKKITEAPK